MFRRKYNELKGKPSLLAAAIQKFALLAGAGFLVIIGFIALVRYQLEPAFHADVYEHLHASFVSRESSLVTALLQRDPEKANLVTSDQDFLENATLKRVILREDPLGPSLNCKAEIIKLDWGTFCHDSEILYGKIPIRSADQLLGWLMIEQKASLSDWLPYARIYQAIWIASLSILILAFFFVVKFLRSTIFPVRKSIEKLEKVESTSDFEQIFSELPFKELVSLASRLSMRSRELADTKAALAEAKREAHFSRVATQVAHDLQSPVAALKQISENIEQIKKEDVVHSIRTSARRIDQISKDILSRFEVVQVEPSTAVTFVVPVVESIVDEVSLAHANTKSIDIEFQAPEHTRASTTSLCESDLARALSNLMNNAVDAVKRKGSGRVLINLSDEKDEVLLTVTDTGVGMKEDDLKKVRTMGGTLHEGGHGLGLSFVKQIVSEIGGRLQIDSHWLQGTKITLHIPKSPKPTWLIEKTSLSPSSKIIVIDDDPSILDFWKRKLKTWNAEFFDHVPDKIKCDLLIIDQEIRGSKETGLDVISRIEKRQKTILSTSYFFSCDIQKKVEELGCFLLPKFLIDHFQIEPVSQEKKFPKIDLVLIDDDPMCRDTWELMAEVQKKNLRTYPSYDEFCKEEPAKETPIYVDKNLSDQISGYSILKNLFEAGYKNLYLTTGEYRTEPKPPEHILSVVSKEFPIRA